MSAKTQRLVLSGEPALMIEWAGQLWPAQQDQASGMITGGTATVSATAGTLYP